MYDMPDDEILGFWGKRPFLAKRIPKDPEESTSAESFVLPPLPDSVSTQPEPLASWREDPALVRHSQPLSVMSESTPQA